MKAFVFAIGLTCWSISIVAQTRIVGRIKDSQQYLPAVNVVLSRDSSMVNVVSTDSLGNFRIDNVRPGSYQLSASMVGYATRTAACIVNEGARIFTVPEITLVESSYALKEVVVSSQKQLLDQKIDRTVINLGGSVTASGNTVLEVLQKSPGVVINKQSNTIAMNGKSGVRIMINEKLIQVSSDVAIQMLQGMSAANIDRVELITTPPANYDADGSGGIIHIVTKENTDLGTNGSVTTTLGARWAETLAASVNLNHRTKKSAYFLDYSILRNHNLHRMNMQRKSFDDGYEQIVTDNSRRENVTTQQNLSTGGEWSLTKKTTINVLLTGYRSNWDMDAVAHDVSQLTADSKSETSTKIKELNIWQSATGSFGIQHQVSAKRRIDLTLDYLFYHNNNPSSYDDNITGSSAIDLSKSTPIHFLVGSLNYRNLNNTSAFTWDAGLKAVTSSLNNRVTVNRLVGDEWIQDPVFSSNSTLHEQVFAGYVSTQWMAARQWQINGGLRYEYTHTLITSVAKEDQVKRKYGYLFPTISLKKKLASADEINFSYARRITRPTYNDIAPYVFFWGPNSFAAGNTSLYPSISDAVTTRYQHGAWSVGLQYTHTQKEIVMMQPEVDTELNSLVYKSQNLRYQNTLSLTNSYSITPVPWWETQGTVLVQYQTARTANLSRNKSYSLYGVNVNLVSSVKLPKDFAIEVSWMYQSRSLLGVSNFLSFGSLNAGVQKKFSQNGTLRLAMDDILSANSWRMRTHSPENNLDVRFNYQFHNRYIRLTYTWNLGNTKLRSVKVKSGSEEERKRVSN